MQIQYRIGLFLVALLSLTFLSCDKENNGNNGKYASGIFVVNEGTFSGSGTISWYNPDTKESVPDVYGAANNGAALGQFVQSVTFHNGKGYICVSGANLVVVVDQNTFEYLDTIGGLKIPRYFLPLDNNYALVSQWGADGLSGSVAKVDLNSNRVIKTISTGKGPERMVRPDASTVLVCNSGGYGTDSTVTVINLNTELEQGKKEVPGINPAYIVPANINGSQYMVLCKGSFLDSSPKGWLGRIDGLYSKAVEPFGSGLAVIAGGAEVFFPAGGKIYKANENGVYPFFEQATYGFTRDQLTGIFYCADPKDFNSNGEVVMYDHTGNKLGAFPCGIAPGDIIIID